MKNHSLSTLSNYSPMPVYLPASNPNGQNKKALFAIYHPGFPGPDVQGRVVQMQQNIAAVSLAAIHEQVAHRAYSISRMMVCYALDALDDGLCEAVTISYAELQQETPQRLSVIAAKILAKAHTLWQELQQYGLHRGQLHDLEAAIKRLVSLSQPGHTAE